MNVELVKKTFAMNIKNNRQQTASQNIKLDNNRHRPENKDDLDSREGEEQLSKGRQVTHNRKERQSERKKIKN
jgi:hypothetical protein